MKLHSNMYIRFATTAFVILTSCRPGNFRRQIIFYQFFHIMKELNVSSFIPWGRARGEPLKRQCKLKRVLPS